MGEGRVSVPDATPRGAVYVEATCYVCKAIVFSELYRPSVRENWPAVAAFYQKQIEAHLFLCPTTRPAA